MAEKSNANIGFEKQLWDVACVLWGHIPAAKYRKKTWGLSSCVTFLVPLKSNIVNWSALRTSVTLTLWITFFCLRSGSVENNSVCGACSRNRGSDRRCNAGYQSGKQVVEERTSEELRLFRPWQAHTWQCGGIFTNNIDMSGSKSTRICSVGFMNIVSLVKTLVEILKHFENCRVLWYVRDDFNTNRMAWK